MNQKIAEMYENIGSAGELEGMIAGVTGEYGNPRADWITDEEVMKLREMLGMWRVNRKKPELPQ